MKLLTKEIEKRLPAIGAVSDQEDVDLQDMTTQVKFFDPAGSWKWYGIEYDPESRIFFGYVKGLENEFGDFSLTELENVKGPLGLGIERDLWFEPTKIKELA